MSVAVHTTCSCDCALATLKRASMAALTDFTILEGTIFVRRKSRQIVPPNAAVQRPRDNAPAPTYHGPLQLLVSRLAHHSLATPWRTSLPANSVQPTPTNTR